MQSSVKGGQKGVGLTQITVTEGGENHEGKDARESRRWAQWLRRRSGHENNHVGEVGGRRP